MPLPEQFHYSLSMNNAVWFLKMLLIKTQSGLKEKYLYHHPLQALPELITPKRKKVTT